MLVDNFDSFSHMLADYLRQAGAEIKVVRNNVPLADLVNQQYSGLVISPGPGTPGKAGNLMEILGYFHDKLPILGICLGHQAIGEYFGARLVQCERPVHGKVTCVQQAGAHPVLQGFPGAFSVTRYHSLELRDLPEALEVILATAEGEIMGISHKGLPVLGVQYHPEAHLTEHGLELIRNWMEVYVQEVALPESEKDQAP